MIDLRILALGAMALLMAVYGASSASGTTPARNAVVATMHQSATGPDVHDRGYHVDGFDLRH